MGRPLKMVMEIPIYKWMINGGSPMDWKAPHGAFLTWEYRKLPWVSILSNHGFE